MEAKPKQIYSHFLTSNRQYTIILFSLIQNRGRGAPAVHLRLQNFRLHALLDWRWSKLNALCDDKIQQNFKPESTKLVPTAQFVYIFQFRIKTFPYPDFKAHAHKSA